MSGSLLPGFGRLARPLDNISQPRTALGTTRRGKFVFTRKQCTVVSRATAMVAAGRRAAYPPLGFVCYISSMFSSSLSLVSRRAWLSGMVCCAVATGAWVAGCGGADVPVGPHEGKRAPAMRLPRLDGATFELSAAPDTPVMLVFWASWCGPCRREATEVAEIVRSYGSRVAVVSINSGEDPTKAALAAKEWGMTWMVALDAQGAASQAYEVQALPTVVVVDRQGIVRYRGNGMPSDAHRLLDGLAG